MAVRSQPPRTALRRRIQRTARLNPRLTHAQIAAWVGCHPSTVSEQLRGSGGVHARRLADGVRGPWLYQANKRLHGFPTEAVARITYSLPNGYPPDLPPRRLIAEAAAADDDESRRGAARHTSCPLWLLRQLLEDPQRDVRSAAASNKTLPGWLLAETAASADRASASAAVANPSCPPAVVTAARRHPDTWVRAAAARSAQRDKIALFAADPAPLVQARCADNPDISAELLQQLAAASEGESFPTVQARVAANPNCPPELLATLARHQAPMVRARVADNPNCPEALLVELSDDPHELVQQALTQPLLDRPGSGEQVAGSGESGV